MKKFMLLYHAPATALADAAANSTPEDRQAGMQQWMNWAQKCGDHLLELGNPLSGGQTVAANGGVSDSNKDVAGYSILQAEDKDSILALLKDHPHLQWRDDCTIEVHEILSM